jgi:hypothetical protein
MNKLLACLDAFSLDIREREWERERERERERENNLILNAFSLLNWILYFIET